jgi:hypothetical protein
MYVSVLTKIEWATLGAIFSQTHLVTLLGTYKGAALENLGFAQCDQSGPIFAHWVIVYFGQIYENKKSSKHFCAIFSPCQRYAFMPWRGGIVVIAYASRPEDPGFESRQGVRFLELINIAVLLSKLNIYCHCVKL